MSKVSEHRLRALHRLPDTYKGFQLGYFERSWPDGRTSYLPAWGRSRAEGFAVEWTEGHIYVASITAIVKLCHECIDYNLRVEALEAKLGRPLTIAELPN